MKMWRRLYGDVFEGSMAGHKDALVLFMYLISRANDDGFVRRSGIRVITACTGLTEEEYVAALTELESPDPHSRSKEHEGRRLIAEDDGWLIVNFQHYQQIQREVHRRESVRQAVARHRARMATVSSNQLTPDNTRLEERRGEEKRGEEEKKDTGTAARSLFVRPTLVEVRAYCLERRNGVDPQAWLDHYESNGWKVGRNPMRSWKAAVRTWERSTVTVQNMVRQAQAPASGDYSALEKARKQREEWERENAS